MANTYFSYAIGPFVAFTKAKSADVNSKFSSISSFLNGAPTFAFTDQVSDPATPATGTTAIYTKGKKLFTIDDSGNVSQVGSGSATGVNYIDNPDAEVGLTGWSTYSEQQSVTVTIATPAVFTTLADHGLSVGQPVIFTTTGALPTGLTTNIRYYVSAVPTTLTFKVSATLGGADVDTTGTQSGVHTMGPAVPTAGTGGTATSTLTRSTSSPLRGVASFLLTKPASARHGEGVSYDFSIDSADKAKMLSVSFDYNASDNFEAASGAVDSHSDIEVFLYDVTNEALIPLSPSRLTAKGSNNYSFKGEFQTASDSASYRLIAHITSSNANAYTFKFDNVIVGPQSALLGAPITDFASFVPTGTWTTNTTYSGKYRRVGDSVDVVVDIELSGAPDATALQVNLPAGLSIDTAKISKATALDTSLGHGAGLAGAVPINYQVLYQSATSVSVVYQSAITGDQTAVTDVAPVTYANGDVITINFSAPIVGYSSTLQMSNDSDTRVIDLIAYNNGGSTTANTAIAAFTTVKDSHGAFDGTTFTVPVSGDYEVDFHAATTTGTPLPQINKNGSLYLTGIGSGVSSSASTVIPGLVAGDTITVSLDSSLTLTSTTTDTVLAIRKISGPASIAASELVAAKYYQSTPYLTGDSSSLRVRYDTKSYDTHGMFYAPTYQFIIPISGKYDISTLTEFAPNATGIREVDAFVNDSLVDVLAYSDAGASSSTVLGGRTILELKAGDILEIRSVQSSGGDLNVAAAGASYDYITITKLK